MKGIISKYLFRLIVISFFAVTIYFFIPRISYSAPVVPNCNWGDCVPDTEEAFVCSNNCNYYRQCVDCATNPMCIGITGCWASDSSAICASSVASGQVCSGGSTATCGDGICSSGESCPADCVNPTSPPPSSYCGDGACNLSAGEKCSNCSDCGDCCTAACSGQGGCNGSCGGGYCCGSLVCAGGSGCCPAGQPYICNGSCSSSPCTTPTPPPSCPNVGYGSSPGSYCGSACVSCGVTSDRYYDSSCNCVTTGTFSSPSYCTQLCGTPTPQPTGTSCTPNAWCGSQCRGACHTSDLYCNSTGTACNVQVGDYVGDWCGCSGPTPTPTSTACRGGGQQCGPGCCPGLSCNVLTNTCTVASTPTPSTPPTGSCGPGMHVDSCLCGGNCSVGGQTGCCPNGTTCNSTGPGYACGGSVGPTPPPATLTISGTVYMDTNGNGSKSASEPGVPGVSVTAVNCVTLCDIRPATTDAAGNYSVTVIYTTGYSVSLVSSSFLSAYQISPSAQYVLPSASNVNFGLWAGNTLQGAIFIDTDSDGVKDVSEVNYSATPITVDMSTGDCVDGLDNDGDGNIDAAETRCHTSNNLTNPYDPMRSEAIGTPGNSYSDSTSGSGGNFTVSNMQNGNYQVYLPTANIPAGYSLTTPNPVFRSLAGGTTATANIGIRQPAPSCVGGLSANPNLVQPGGTSILTVTNCTNVPTPTPSPFTWDPDTGGHNPPPIIGTPTIVPPPPANPTESRIPWTAPTCQPTQIVYTPRVTVGHSGNTILYSTAITVPASYTLTAHVRAVTDVSSCSPTSGAAYQSGGVGAALHLEGGSSFTPRNQTTDGTDAGTLFTCLPNDSYQLSLQVPNGYTVVGRNISAGTYLPLGGNGMSFTMSAARTATFCIAPLDPWFQTDRGDVRFKVLDNPVPSGQTASTNTTYPGIFYSSNSNADLGSGGNAASSAKQWLINNEYSYNADTENRNGGMSYDFFRAKALKDGVPIRSIPGGTFSQSSIATNEKVIYESDGPLTINSYTHPVGRNIVILVKGKATIGGNISIPSSSQGVFIVAARDDIEILNTVGTPDPINATTLAQTTTNLDGYYTAQGSIKILSRGNSCADGITSDRRLNVGGALIANSLKPFARSAAGGVVDNDRSLCTNNLTLPSLYIASRPDFLIRLTDFYKTSYTKWQEINP